MMVNSWDSNLHTLLLFKDSPESVEQGFQLAAQSLTILRHAKLARRVGEILPAAETLSVPSQQDLFAAQAVNPAWSDDVPDNCCVWGWWRKPWEGHPKLFERLDGACRAGQYPTVLLYNQYQRRLYRASLRALYHRPFLTSVVIPVNWEPWCPEYYRGTPRLCGAFFALQIDAKPLDAEGFRLNQLFVDASSFELSPQGVLPVIPVPDGIDQMCDRMVDQPLTRALLRSSEHTVVLVRGYKQAEHLRHVLADPSRVQEAELLTAVRETAWEDLRALLIEESYPIWASLHRFPSVIAETARKARQQGQRITRFDLDLVAWACSPEGLTELLAPSGKTATAFTPLAASLIKWGLAVSGTEARHAAAHVFEEAWRIAEKRYTVAPLQGYLEQLPAVEAIISAVKYELGGKFYRDHLSHNVRGALLAARLTSSARVATVPAVPLESKDEVIAFYGGLLHDIAHPIAGFAELVRQLGAAFSKVGLAQDRMAPPGLIDNKQLMQGLNHLANLLATPNLRAAYRDTAYRPWENPKEAVRLADKELLSEILKCAVSQDHAFMGAAVVFHQAALGRCRGNLDQYGEGLRTLLLELTGPAATPHGRELLELLQCMALHDRRAGAKHFGISTVPSPLPSALSWDAYRLPILVHIADELQEWGRPMASLEGMWAVDAAVDLDLPTIRLRLTANTDTSSFTDVAFSLLESLMGKVRGLSDVHHNGGPVSLYVDLTELPCFAVEYVTGPGFEIRLSTQNAHHVLEKWPYQTIGTDDIRGLGDEHLLALTPHSSGQSALDYLIAAGDSAVQKVLIELAKSRTRLLSLSLEQTRLAARFADGSLVEGQVTEYWYGAIDRRTVPLGKLPASGGAAIVRVSLDRVTVTKRTASLTAGAEPPHLVPRPHVLDFDWRFTRRSAQWIAGAARHYAHGGRVCYLGCPTVAMWHQQIWPDAKDWVLIDRGHYALRNWLTNWIPPERYIEHNVFAPLPGAALEKFEVVITDPPWYRDEYRAFCRRASQLVRDGGYIAISSYPTSDPYKRAKHDYFTSVVRTELGKATWIGSFEIDYEVPDFERIWGGHKPFENSELGVYRPASMDVYHVQTSPHIEGNGLSEHPSQMLRETFPLTDGHYARYAGPAIFPCSVEIRRRNTLKRMLECPADLIGWTTTNAVVYRSDKGRRVVDADALASTLLSWENEQARAKASSP